MKTFFTADTHFGHTNIIKYCNRPYANADDMNQCMVQLWNTTVGQDDVVYHLGDFSFHGAESIFHKLNGHKHLIIGNHDDRKVLTLPWASQPQHYREIRLKDGQDIERRIVLFHYPIEEWDGYYKGSLHFHGHVHGKQMKPCEKVRVDVAVDCFGFKPATLDEILAKVQNNG